MAPNTVPKRTVTIAASDENRIPKGRYLYWDTETGELVSRLWDPDGLRSPERSTSRPRSFLDLGQLWRMRV